MQEFYLQWATEYATGETEIDKNYQKILDAGLLFYQYLYYDNQAQEKMLELSKEINEIIVNQMRTEENLLKSFCPNDFEAHRRDHLSYNQRFDLKQRCSFSPKMRIEMCYKMIKEFIERHFFDFDVPDLQKIKEQMNNARQQAS